VGGQSVVAGSEISQRATARHRGYADMTRISRIKAGRQASGCRPAFIRETRVISALSAMARRCALRYLASREGLS